MTAGRAGARQQRKQRDGMQVSSWQPVKREPAASPEAKPFCRHSCRGMLAANNNALGQLGETPNRAKGDHGDCESCPVRETVLDNQNQEVDPDEADAKDTVCGHRGYALSGHEFSFHTWLSWQGLTLSVRPW